MANNPNDQAFLEYLVKSIVEYPDKVEITRKVDEMGVLLILKVAPQDMGLIVGRQGSTAKAVRSLLRIVGIRNNARVNLKIEEPEGSTFQRPERPSFSGETEVNADLKL
ncbi:KH domain-containing protein [Patescibacteria group bacterium]|nr:KH domain-containing protein [Patescibacteria group bacterium]